MQNEPCDSWPPKLLFVFRRRTNLNCVVGLYDDDVIDRAAETARRSRAAVVERDHEIVGAPRAPRLHVPATRTRAGVTIVRYGYKKQWYRIGMSKYKKLSS
jgi:hypothetical protein